MQERTGALTAYAQSRISDRDALTPDEIDAQLPPVRHLYTVLRYHFISAAQRSMRPGNWQVAISDRPAAWRVHSGSVGGADFQPGSLSNRPPAEEPISMWCRAIALGKGMLDRKARRKQG